MNETEFAESNLSEKLIKFEGDLEFEPDKVVTVQLIAEVPGSFGTAVIDIRRWDYSGGSLRSLRASVDFDSNIRANGMTMPVGNDEQMIIRWERYNQAAAPIMEIRTSKY